MAQTFTLARWTTRFMCVPASRILHRRVVLILMSYLQVYDLRKSEEVYTLSGHVDTPTSLSLSPDGTLLLSPSFSSQTIIHDIRPFSPAPSRIHRVLQGAPAGFENTLLRGAWSRDDGGQRVAVGGADRMVCVWEVDSGKILYKVRDTLLCATRSNVAPQLPGHKGTVTSVDFHPKEPVSECRFFFVVMDSC
jgi:Prp8 binding protein